MTDFTHADLVRLAEQADTDAEQHRRNGRYQAQARCEERAAAFRAQAEAQGPDPEADPTVAAAVGLVTKDEVAAMFQSFAAAVDAMIDDKIAIALGNAGGPEPDPNAPAPEPLAAPEPPPEPPVVEPPVANAPDPGSVGADAADLSGDAPAAEPTDPAAGPSVTTPGPGLDPITGLPTTESDGATPPPDPAA